MHIIAIVTLSMLYLSSTRAFKAVNRARGVSMGHRAVSMGGIMDFFGFGPKPTASARHILVKGKEVSAMRPLV